MTTRREVLAGAVLLLLARLAGAQQRSYRMAMLLATSPSASAHLAKALFGRLAELGYREGQNLVVDRRYAEARVDRMPALAAELVALKPEVILASTNQGALAASKATSTIPIVFVAVNDPVGLGIVKSLSRPGTNATGFSAQNVEIQGKRLQLLKEVFSSASRVAVLYDPLNPGGVPLIAALKNAGATLALNLQLVEVRSSEEFVPAFKTLEASRPDVLYVLESPLIFQHRGRFVELANSRRLPAMYGLQEFAEAGGLMSYSFVLIDHYRAAATYIDKVLTGARPAELPVEHPMRFELVLNLKTAKAQGITFPSSILLRADRVIE